ncbi:uncharacterized protein LOC121799171 [Salvia splendens]|uniref:uncharacterized protein LOC121799171 n=1 Tax=Salvia splendens TaxID=180675 RepID=UPI001C27E44A|nr:uncharacterized protein LOC121799171 [Salvia splendens]
MHFKTQTKTPSPYHHLPHILTSPIIPSHFPLILTQFLLLDFETEDKGFLKACLRLVLLLGFLQFLITEAHHHHHHRHQEPRIRAFRMLVMKKEASGNMKNEFVEAMNMVKKKHRNLSKLELNYTSKRRVPNGPDPIHNRGAGKSHRPPGHA